MAAKSNNTSNGRYSQGGKVEDLTNRLGWWERRAFTKSPTDVQFTLTTKYNRRPDLLAYELYGKSSLQWFILQYNTITDITTFEAGLVLTLPTKARLVNEILSKRA